MSEEEEYKKGNKTNYKDSPNDENLQKKRCNKVIDIDNIKEKNS